MGFTLKCFLVLVTIALYPAMVMSADCTNSNNNLALWLDGYYGDANIGIANCASAEPYCRETGPDERWDTLRQICCKTCCVDDDTGLALYVSENHPQMDVQKCADVYEACTSNDNFAEIANIYCCQTCLPRPPVVRDLPPNDDNNPVQLFLLGGQSEAAGAASHTRLKADVSTYPTLGHVIPQAWLAGRYDGEYEICTLEAGKEKKTGFGPEISFAERIQTTTGKRVMIVKYAWGGE